MNSIFLPHIEISLSLSPNETLKSRQAKDKYHAALMEIPAYQLQRFLFMDIRALRERREEILQIATKHGARTVRIFGSVARGEADSASDLDLLVEMEPGRSLLDLGGLLMELQDLLGCQVDVVTEKGLRERIRDRVLKDAVAL